MEIDQRIGEFVLTLFEGGAKHQHLDRRRRYLPPRRQSGLRPPKKTGVRLRSTPLEASPGNLAGEARIARFGGKTGPQGAEFAINGLERRGPECFQHLAAVLGQERLRSDRRGREQQR